MKNAKFSGYCFPMTANILRDFQICISVPVTKNVYQYIEISQLICNANQLTGFYMMGTLNVTGLK